MVVELKLALCKRPEFEESGECGAIWGQKKLQISRIIPGQKQFITGGNCYLSGEPLEWPSQCPDVPLSPF